MGGWNGKYTEAKKDILEGLAASVVFLNETWLQDQQTIQLDGYTWCGNNRSELNRDAPRGSGGVGCLIHKTVMDIYVDVVEIELDSIISLKNKCSSLKALLIGVYLPPENSVYGNHID